MRSNHNFLRISSREKQVRKEQKSLKAISGGFARWYIFTPWKNQEISLLNFIAHFIEEAIFAMLSVKY